MRSIVILIPKFAEAFGFEKQPRTSPISEGQGVLDKQQRRVFCQIARFGVRPVRTSLVAT